MDDLDDMIATEEYLSDGAEEVGSALLSCKICGLKPHPFDDAYVGFVKFMCDCGASGSWAETTVEARVHWDKLAFCPNWNHNKPNEKSERR